MSIKVIEMEFKPYTEKKKKEGNQGILCNRRCFLGLREWSIWNVNARRIQYRRHSINAVYRKVNRIFCTVFPIFCFKSANCEVYLQQKAKYSSFIQPS